MATGVAVNENMVSNEDRTLHSYSQYILLISSRFSRYKSPGSAEHLTTVLQETYDLAEKCTRHLTVLMIGNVHNSLDIFNKNSNFFIHFEIVLDKTKRVNHPA